MCVLVVEDDPIILLGAAIAVQEAGYEVLTAEHAPRAVSFIELWPGRFTCLITDHLMPPPAMTGAELVAHMRQFYPAIPMIVATALGSAITEAWQRQHRVEMMLKPYDLDGLGALVRRLLGGPPDARSAQT